MAPKIVRQSSQVSPSLVVPRYVRSDGAAAYISGTIWFVEELMRNGEIPFIWVGKAKVLDLRDLDAWMREHKTRTEAGSEPMPLKAYRANKAA